MRFSGKETFGKILTGEDATHGGAPRGGPSVITSRPAGSDPRRLGALPSPCRPSERVGHINAFTTGASNVPYRHLIES